MDYDKKTEILHIIKELLKKKCNSCEVFFDIFKHIGIDIKNLYSSVAPYLFIAFSDNKCCSLVWKVDKYIDIEGNPVIVPSRCAKNRIDKSSLYCRSHNNPKLNQYCNLCSKQHQLPNSKYIYCKKCDIAIGLSRESDNDGFDADDRLIQFREAVIETSMEDILEKIEAENREDLSSISFDSDGKILKVLNDLITNPNIEIP